VIGFKPVGLAHGMCKATLDSARLGYAGDQGLRTKNSSINSERLRGQTRRVYPRIIFAEPTSMSSADQTHSSHGRGLAPVNVTIVRCRASSMPDDGASRLTTALAPVNVSIVRCRASSMPDAGASRLTTALRVAKANCKAIEAIALPR